MDKWIKVEDRMPDAGRPVDVFMGGRRHCNYRLIVNYNDTPGNDFFEPLHGGISCIRPKKSDDDILCATHWMDVPLPPSGN